MEFAPRRFNHRTRTLNRLGFVEHLPSNCLADRFEYMMSQESQPPHVFITTTKPSQLPALTRVNDQLSVEKYMLDRSKSNDGSYQQISEDDEQLEEVAKIGSAELLATSKLNIGLPETLENDRTPICRIFGVGTDLLEEPQENTLNIKCAEKLICPLEEVQVQSVTNYSVADNNELFKDQPSLKVSQAEEDKVNSSQVFDKLLLESPTLAALIEKLEMTTSMLTENVDLLKESVQKAKAKGTELSRKKSISTSGPIHTNVKCDVCLAEPIQGKRFKCLVCINFDICESCEGANLHQHTLMLLNEPMSNDFCDSFGSVFRILTTQQTLNASERIKLLKGIVSSKYPDEFYLRFVQDRQNLRHKEFIEEIYKLFR